MTKQEKKLTYAEKTALEFIEMIKAGTAPWMNPIRVGVKGLPYNMESGRPYSGMNVLRLLMSGYSDPRWLTFHQAKAKGHGVKKGMKATRIMFYTSSYEKENESGDKEIKRGGVKFYNMFNASQFDTIDPLHVGDIPEFEIHQRAESLLKNSKAVFEIGGVQPAYAPNRDVIKFPKRDSFISESAYYQTALHELGHWTGAANRLDRGQSGKFGSAKYAEEELIVEMASCMVALSLGVGHNPQNSAAYVGSWIKALENDPKFIMQAATQAQKCHDMLMSFDKAESVEDKPKTPNKAKVQVEKLPAPTPTVKPESVPAPSVPAVQAESVEPKKKSRLKGAIQAVFNF